VARPESWTPRGVQPKSRALHGRQPRSAKQATEELHRVRRSAIGLPGGRSASPCSESGQTAWTRGRIASSCFGRGLTAWARGLTASCGQRQEPRGNVRHRVWCGHGNCTGSHPAEKCLNHYLDEARQRRRSLPHQKQYVGRR
jgi:hypothetical protein